MSGERDRGRRVPEPERCAGPVADAAPEPDADPGGARPYPVPNAAAYLAGRWDVERTVHDLRTGAEGHFRGTAEFRPEGTGDALLHVEEGQLTWDGTVYPASRTLRLRPRPDGTAGVEFADGRPFHDLDLRTGRWTARHLCAEDRYEGSFTAVAADEWRLRWRVGGPAKDQLLRSVYRRRG
ncbi:DUF6314 family protein [Streptomyces kronopolitis]|uniref:DUF6314 family protein n=1 Tax=Streptomyces kronopolitis TaxID=1612435 RepID=UPI00368B7AF1